MKTRLAFWHRILFPPEKPWEAPGDIELGWVLLVIVYIAIWINSYGMYH